MRAGPLIQFLFPITLIALGACRNRPVSVAVPDRSEIAGDLEPLDVHGDTSWRISAAADAATWHVGRPATMPGSRSAPSRATARRPGDPEHGMDAISPESVNAEPDDELLADDEGPAILRAQILLDRVNFSSGVLNGKAGQNTAKAIYFFQAQNDLPRTGTLDRATYDKLAALAGDVTPVVQYTLTREDARGPYFWIPASVYAQEELPCECYASALEMLDERFHTITDVLRRLNPSFNFVKPQAGATLWVPNVEPFNARGHGRALNDKPIAKIHVAKDGRYLHALAADGSIVYHFPTTVGSEYDPSPSGTYRITDVQWRPVFHYNPRLYSDVPNSSPRATLPAGPNSPVGIVWISTSKDHVGIHGTPLPHTIGLASSHGCVRLANWDAAKLAASVRPGTPVVFVH